MISSVDARVDGKDLMDNDFPVQVREGNGQARVSSASGDRDG